MSAVVCRSNVVEGGSGSFLTEGPDFCLQVCCNWSVFPVLFPPYLPCKHEAWRYFVHILDPLAWIKHCLELRWMILLFQHQDVISPVTEINGSLQ